MRLAIIGVFAWAHAGVALAAEPTTQSVTVGVQHNMAATLYTPDGPGPFPTILLMHTSQGLTETDRSFCFNLARQGYICIVPAFLAAHGNLTGEFRHLAFSKEAVPIFDDFVEIIGELNRLPKAKQGAVGAIGFSNGGYFALWLAGRNKVKAAVSYYGALNGGNTDRNLHRMQSNFTAQSAPVLVLAGQNDTTIGMEPVQHLEQILNSCGAPHELKVYPDAEHAFDRSNSRPGNRAAEQDARQRTLGFFKRELQ